MRNAKLQFRCALADLRHYKDLRLHLCRFEVRLYRRNTPDASPHRGDRDIVANGELPFDPSFPALSLVSGVKSALSSIETKSNGSVDYLVQTQGGPPNGAWNLTSEGIHSGFAVQILSRFLIGYELSKRGILKQSQVIVGAPGGSQTQFDVDDVELASQKDRYWIPLLVEMGKRDGLITDTYTKVGLITLSDLLGFVSD